MKMIEEFRENPALVKLDLLLNGVNIDNPIELNENEAPERYIYDSSKNTNRIMPSEIILPKKIVSNIYPSKESSWAMKNRTLFYKNEKVFEIEFTPEPQFSKIKLSDGTLASKIAIMYGLDVFSIFINRICSLYTQKEGCHFCSIDYNKKNKGKENIAHINIGQVLETFKLALEKDKDLFHHVLLTSGAYKNPDYGIIDQVKYIKSMKKLGDKSLKYHLVTLPPKSDDLFITLARDGPDSLGLSIEVFDPNLFKKYCPGKEKEFGYDDFISSFVKASNVFPKNAVKAGFVCGLESIDSLVKGMNFFGEIGIPSSLNIFHPDEGTKLATLKRPSKEYMLEILSEQKKINEKYNLIPVFPEFGRRSSLDTEVYKGFFR